jgi:hypothetical protein
MRIFPKVEFIPETADGDIFRLLEPVKFVWNGKEFTVPAGFTCDGASIPAFLWASVSPRIDTRTLAGSIGHDYLYRNTPEGWSRKDADDLFYDAIRDHGLSWWKAQKAYWGVRIFGGIFWGRNNKHSEPRQGGGNNVKCE